MIGPTPLLDFFKRGEVERDVRLLAAQGGLAPRAYEQLAMLIILVEDPDKEIRETAEETLTNLPLEALQTFLARSDIPIGMREFFADRGIFPDEIPTIEAEVEFEEPLLDTAAPVEEDEFGDLLAVGHDEDRESSYQKLAKMGFTDRLRAAMKGTKEMRAILIRDPNKMISAAVMSSPKLTGQEVEAFSRMATIPEDVLRAIGHNRAYLKNYNIVLGLTKNPKTPLGLSLNLMGRLNQRDMAQLSVDRNVPEALRIAARKKVVQATSGKG
ncbi:MAG: hypothetical protein LAO77_06200 [Acidobacteriia bacterium]|nr:hypothetical protein [Terriglobia bacterium]